MLTRGRGLGGLATIGSVANPSVAIIKDNNNVYKPDPAGATAVSEYIGRQLNLQALQNREKSLIDAINDPSKWIKEREANLKNIQNRLGELFQQEMAKYYEAGYSLEQSQLHAERACNGLLQIELEDLEAIQPGANSIYANATFQMQNRNNRARLYNGEAESSVDERAVYKKLRAQKKAKKQKRRAKKQAKIANQ